MRRKSQLVAAICFGLLLTGVTALAQGHPGGGGPGGGGPGGGGPGGGGMGGPGGGGFGSPGGMGNGGRTSPGSVPASAPGPSSGSAGGSRPGGSGPGGPNGGPRGLQLGPPGRWWDDKSFAKSLGLSKEQQKKMDGVFNANKGAIVESYNSLQKAESRLQTLSQEQKPDETKIFAALDSVAEARVALQKANAHMLLLVRQEMDADQITRLEKAQE